MNKRPPRNDLRSAAALLRRDAAHMLRCAQEARQRAAATTRPKNAEINEKLAREQEARAAAWSRVADWILDV